jgi:queuine/archaeosine tRNA-ribosyltransferase
MKYSKRTIYIPAVSIATHMSVMTHDWKLNGKTARFYLNGMDEKTQIFHHPYMLTSAAHNYEKTDYAKVMGIKDLKTDIDMLFGDSGGFQIATGAIKVKEDTQDKIYTWLENNTTVAPIIDHPPYTTGMTNLGKADMSDSLNKSLASINLLKSRPTMNKTEWLNVSHGRTYEQRKWWIENIDKEDFFSGWAIGSLRKNNYVILSAFCSLLDAGILERESTKLIHFFGLSSMRFIPLMVYINHKMKQKGYKINVSFDSSYATKDCAFGKYLTMMPDSKGFASYHLSNKYIGKFNPEAGLPCKCAICDGLKLGDVLNENSLKASGKYYFYNVVQSHNVLILRDYIEKIENVIQTDCEFFWTSAFKSDYMKTFKIVDSIFDAPKGKSYGIIEKFQTFLNQDDEENETDSIEELFEV